MKNTSTRFAGRLLGSVIILLFSVLVLGQGAWAQSIRYVKQGGTGSGNSWADASGDLQSQINFSGAQQVWVAAGIYKPTTGTDRNASFSLTNGVSVYGGFAGTETDLSQRGAVNPVTGSPSSSILSGDIGVIGNRGDNSYYVISNSSLNSTAVLDGFIISGGNNSLVSSGNGGGMYNTNSSPSLSNCSFLNNSAFFTGGGMYNTNSSPSLSNCSFLNNSATSNGGGIGNENGSSPSLTNCSFQNNSAAAGGGMYNNGSSRPLLTNCVLFGNRGIFGIGGSNTIYNTNSSLTARYSLFEASVTGYTDGGNNLTTTTSPFASASSAQLSPCSPAINAGDPASTTASSGTTDLAGNPRFYQGGRIDMGAYEYQGEPTLITVSNPTTSTATQGVAFSQSFTAVGGSSPYSFSVVSGTLPGGLSLATTGALSGTPTQAGSYSVTVRATDANGCAGTGAAYSLTVNAAIPTIADLAASPAAVCVGSPVTFTATIGNLTGSYAYTLTNGSSTSIAGSSTSSSFSQSLTAAGSGNQSFTLTVEQSGQSTQATTGVTVNATPTAGLTNNGPLTCAQTSVTLTASGGTSYSFSTGATPIGTSNRATVTTAGTYSVTVINGVNGCSSVASTTVDQAATTRLTWTGQTSTDWNTAGNWCPARVPLSTDDVVIPATPPNKPVLGTNTVANSVEVQSGASLAITNAGILTLNGSKSNGTNTVTLFTSGTVTNSGQVVIGNLPSATVGELGVLNQGVFQNNTGGSIRIDRTTSHGFQNRGTGTITNSATITIGQSASIGGIGILSNGTASFSNTVGGYIQIDNTGNNGIGLLGGTFTNAAVVRIGSFSTIGGIGISSQGNSVVTNAIGGDISVNRTDGQGVVCFGTFVNSSTLTIGNIAFSGQDNIENQGTFTNTATGVINADRTANRNGNGIWNAANTFTNSGTISIRFLSITAGNGILNTGTSFANLAGGRIQLDRVMRGVANRTTFTNGGEIRMGDNAPLGDRGIQNTTNNALFTNLAGGVISIGQTAYTRDGIINEAGNTFTNSGTISIGTSGSIAGNGITNAGTLNNGACATLTVFDNVANSGSFTNAGLLTVSTTQSHTNTGSFINTGDIAYPQGNPIPNVTNNNPFDAPVIGCVSGISPALQLGENSSQLTIGTTWYKDPALTQPAGSYDQASNTFTPSNLTAGSTTILYFSVTYGANACTKTESVTVTLNPQVTASISPESAILTCASPTVSLTASGGASYIWDDNSTNPVRTVSAAGIYSVTVLSSSECAGVASTTVTSNTATIAVGNPTTTTATQGVVFSQSFTVVGGSSPYSFSVVEGNLPSGLSLATTGALSGTPTQAGSYSVTVQATDANGCVGTGTTYTLTVDPAALPCGSIVYVTQDGAGLQNGSSWANALAGAALQTAINTAGTCGEQVWVAAGVYKPTSTIDRGISFQLLPNVAIYGGFVGNETTLSQRPSIDPVTGNPSSSTLSGDIGTPGNASDNTYTIVSASQGLTSTAVLDGFVITNGAGSALSINGDNGVCSPTIRKCAFINNTGSSLGGAVTISANEGVGNPTMTNCSFINNSASLGGAVFANGTGTGISNYTLVNCSFTNNRATLSFRGGGAIYNVASENQQTMVGGTCNPTITACMFDGNSAAVDGGAIYNYAFAGMPDQSYFNTCSPILTDCRFSNNTAGTGSGGAIINGASRGVSSPVITRCSFTGNVASNKGGALYNEGSEKGNSSPIITNCSFTNNSVPNGGGGAMANNGGLGGRSAPLLINCTFVGNYALGGGVMYNEGSSQDANQVSISSPELINCSLSGNTASYGSWLFYNYNANPHITNSVLFGNGTNSAFNLYDVASTLIDNSLIEPSLTNYTSGPGNMTVTTSPFVSATDLNLTPCSPAINAGNNQAYATANGPATDLAGNTRVFGGTIDMGAYEYQAAPNPQTGITMQPLSGSSVCARGTVTAIVSVSGSGPFTYQWYKNNLATAVSGQASAVLSLTNVSVTDAGSYSVVVTGNCNSVTSAAFSLTVNALPTSASLTSGTLTCSTTSATLVASATGGSSYTLLGGPASQSNTTGEFMVSTAGTYTAIIANASGCTATATATVTSNTATPMATLTASSTTACAPASITLTAGGGTSYTFSAGATQISTSNQAIVTQSGTYSVTVSNAAGCTATNSVSVTVNTPPAAPTLTGVSRTVTQSNTPLPLGQFVQADNGNTLSFSGVSGAIANPPTANISQAGVQSFSVTQTSASGCVSPATAFTITVQPSAVTTPGSQTVCRSSAVVLSATTVGVRYEWYKNGQSAPFKLTEIASIQRGTATSSLTVVSIQTSASYYVKVFQANGSFVFDGPFVVTVNYGCIAPGARLAAPEVAEVPLRVVLTPNPVADGQVRAVVTGAAGRSLSVQLLDLRGEVVREQTWAEADESQRVEWDITTRPAGLYLLRATASGQTSTLKVMKP